MNKVSKRETLAKFGFITVTVVIVVVVVMIMLDKMNPKLNWLTELINVLYVVYSLLPQISFRGQRKGFQMGLFFLVTS